MNADTLDAIDDCCGGLAAALGLDVDAADDIAAMIASALTRRSSEQPIRGLLPIESRVVRILKRRRGRVFSAREIVECSRGVLSKGGPDEVGDKLATVVICKIRKKRPDLGARIETIWGRGYRWRDDPATMPGPTTEIVE